jgi:hypothetical protein
MPGSSGLAGTIRISIVDTPNGAVFLHPTTIGIVENPADSGLYHWAGTAPTTNGTYSIIWDRGSNANLIAVEELVVSGSLPADQPTTGPTGVYPNRFGTMNRFLSERCSIMRYLQIGSDEGTPIQGLSILESSVPCRYDPVGGRRDALYRTNMTTTSLEHGVCYLPPEVEVLPSDHIAITVGAHAGYVLQTISGQQILAAFGAHHNEVEVERVLNAS